MAAAPQFKINRVMKVLRLCTDAGYQIIDKPSDQAMAMGHCRFSIASKKGTPISILINDNGCIEFVPMTGGDDQWDKMQTFAPNPPSAYMAAIADCVANC